MTPYLAVARKKSIVGSTLSYPATATYKEWVWAQLKKREWSLGDLASAMKRASRTISVTTSALSQFLGPEDGPHVPSNTSLMPAMNKALGIAPPPVCDPTETLAQLHDRLAARWKILTPRERDLILRLLADDDEEIVDSPTIQR